MFLACCLFELPLPLDVGAGVLAVVFSSEEEDVLLLSLPSFLGSDDELALELFVVTTVLPSNCAGGSLASLAVVIVLADPVVLLVAVSSSLVAAALLPSSLGDELTTLTLTSCSFLDISLALDAEGAVGAFSPTVAATGFLAMILACLPFHTLGAGGAGGFLGCSDDGDAALLFGDVPSAGFDWAGAASVAPVLAPKMLTFVPFQAMISKGDGVCD